MSVRRIALSALRDIVEDGAYANLRLRQATDGLSARDAAFVTALVHETLDRLITIDHILSDYVTKRQNVQIRNILRLGCCELLYMDTPAYAAISENVSLCIEIGKGAIRGLVNAVLHRIDRERALLPRLPEDPIQRLCVRYSYPEWLIRRWSAAYGMAFTEEMLSVGAFPTEVRAQYPFTTEALMQALPVGSTRGTFDENCLLLSDGFDVVAHPAFLDGRMAAQSQSAMLACRALGDCRGLSVLDACAAPGGKSAYLYSLHGGNIKITAWDVHAHRVELIQKTFERLHVRASVSLQDAAEPIPALAGAFDRVLLDVPCSGLGLLHEKPDIRYVQSDARIESLAALQASILHTCCRYVRPGGVLVYATCTISQAENEAQIRSFLSAQPSFSLSPLPIPVENDGMLQLFPHIHRTDGFFLARMIKCT